MASKKKGSEVVAALERLLASSYTLYLKTHNFHWNVKGPMFTTLHTLFELEYSELALAALRRSYVDLNGTNLGMIWGPFRNPLRADPRFKEILRDVGLIGYFRASGNWADLCRPLAGGDDFECR